MKAEDWTAMLEQIEMLFNQQMEVCNAAHAKTVKEHGENLASLMHQHDLMERHIVATKAKQVAVTESTLIASATH